MPGIYKLEDIKEYFLEIFTETTDYEFIINDNRIEELYKLIYAPYVRVNDNDKKWIAYSSQDHERNLAIKSIKNILDDNSISYTNDTIVAHITNNVDQVGKIFDKNSISHKPRIPFYILVLNKLLS